MPSLIHRTPVSLDEKSALRIARSRISQSTKDRTERLQNRCATPHLKRIAWLRSIKRDVEHIWGESLIAVGSDNRKVYFASLEQLGEHDSWLSITTWFIRFRAVEPVVHDVALISPHAIARVMERTRNIDTVSAVSSELLPWTVVELLKDSDRGAFLIVPTEQGYFTGEDDKEKGILVLTTWYVDRTISDREQDRLSTLRVQKRLGFARKLSDVV